MKITLLTLVGLFILSACAPARPSIPSTLTVDNPTLTESVESPRPRPSRTPRPSQTPYPTHTEWVKVYPTKKALLIYSSSFRSQYTINFIEWGDFYPEPYWVLYEDGQLIFGIGGYEKQLSQADTQAIISKLEQLGLPKLQEAYEANPDSIFTVPPDMEYNPSSSNIEITFDQNGPKSIRYQEYWEEHLIQPMKEIISYLNSFSSAGATPYQPDRLLVVPREIEQIPEGETVIPWPEDVSSPLHRSYKGLYLEGNEALTFYKAAGEYLFGYFSYEGKNYEVYLRPILPHECHIYHLSQGNLPPPAQPAFTCDDW
jgi:hypothetical protein